MSRKGRLTLIVCLLVAGNVFPTAGYGQSVTEPMKDAFELIGVMAFFLLIIGAFFVFLAYDAKKKQVGSPEDNRANRHSRRNPKVSGSVRKR